MQQTKISNSDPTSYSQKPTPFFIPFLFVAAYTLLCVAAIFFFVRGMGAIVGSFLDSGGVIAAALAQLANARVSVPFWIPLSGAAVVCVFRGLLAKRLFWRTATVTAVSVVFLLLAFIAAFLLTRINGVLIYVSIGIIKMLLESGMF